MSWADARLDEIADVRLGRQRSPKNHTGSRMRPYLRAANVTWDGLDLSDVKEMNFTEQESAVYELIPGDVLVAEASGSASEVGKAAIWRGEIEGCCFQNTLIRVRSRGVSAEYLRYFLLSEARSGRIGNAAPGVGIHHIGAGRLSEWPVRVAPLNEQPRIVAAIEEHLSRLDAADASLALAVRRLDGMTDAALSTSLNGAWPEQPLNDVIISLRNGMFVSRPATEPPGTAIFRISAVRPLTLNVDDVRYAPLVESDAADYLVDEGDLLFTRYSGNPDYVGACARVKTLPQPTLHPDKLIRVVVDRNQVEPAFLEMRVRPGGRVTRFARDARRQLGRLGSRAAS